MIKIMDRSLRYYIKRPMFTYGLIGHSRSVRLYSLFVMDLLEQDLLEYKRSSPNSWSIDMSLFVKGTTQRLEYQYMCLYINRLLRKKLNEIENRNDEAQVKKNMALALQAMQTNLEGETK